MYTSELMSNPVQLYIESGIRTLYLAGDVFNLIIEHENTQKMEKNVEELRDKYNLLAKEKLQHYEEKRIKQIDIKYQSLKDKIEKKRFYDKEVTTFITLIRKDLLQLMEYLEELQKSDSYSNIDKVGELTRRVFHDYNGLLDSFIEEEIEIDEQKNGNNGKENDIYG